jgi:AcrR family transcriptional regulator
MSTAMPNNSAGRRTRAAILQQAAELATLDGLNGLSIGDLAQATGMSKAGLYAHFGSKQELQLATVETARTIFVAEVIRPALAAPRGVRRLLAMCEAFLSHIERRVFPGGCFFVAATAEVGARPGAVHDAVARQQQRWIELLERIAREAQELGELPADTDPPQLAFELEALLVAANSQFLLHGDRAVFDRARAAIRGRLGQASPLGDPRPAMSAAR